LDDLEGAAVLDLYAGTGVLGVEALSRGASTLVSVERSPRTLARLQANLEALGLADRARVLADDAPRAVRRLAASGERFDLVLLDPPYAGDELDRALEALGASGILASNGRVVAERSRRHSVPAVAGLRVIDERRYGDTTITQLEATGPEKPGGEEDR
jgi:16S rRNA (guanine966-N2)-methyltransferase